MDSFVEALKSGSPTLEGLKERVMEDLAIPDDVRPPPAFAACAAAAALLDDPDLFKRTVGAMQSRDSYYRWKQKMAGVDKDDLGPYPTDARARELVCTHLEGLLGSVPAALRDEIRAWVARV